MIIEKFIKGVTAITLFLTLYTIIYLTHIWYFKVGVVFYSAILDGLIAVFLTSTALFLYSGFSRSFDLFDKTLLTTFCALLSYAIAISVPTVIDRSLSFYILEKLEQRGGSIQLDKFEEIFTEEYVHEHRLMDVRLTEQQESGTINVEGNCVTLTSRGSLIASFSRYFRQNLLPKKRLLMGEYSDDLTDPFRNSVDVKDYSCEPES